MADSILFDRDEVEHLESVAERPRRLRGSQLLWIDLARGEDTEELARELDLTPRTRQYLEAAHESPVFQDCGHYIHITSYAPKEDDDGGELLPIECVVGQNWVLTAHAEPIPVLDEFAKRVSGSGNTGELDGPGFLAALLEWVLGSYTSAFERIEERLEKFDVQAMRGEGADEDIEMLVEMRLQVGKLRRALAAHRTPLVAPHASGARSARGQRLGRTI